MPAGRKRAPPVGIDLGTTHCCMAYLDQDGSPHIIKMADGKCTMPSVVAFTRSRRVVGTAAKTDFERSDENTIYDAKRLLGCRFDDPQVQKDMECWPFEVVCDPKTKLPKYRVQERGQEVLYAPEQISGLVLEELRTAAEKHFKGLEVSDVVITVPAYFNDDQRQATKAAARIAGMEVMVMINEPTAAALSFGLHNVPERGERYVLVFDLGGGTLDVVLLRHSAELLEVKNLGGDTHLGGQDFDWHIMALALQAWDQQHPTVELECGTRGWRRLRLACEAAKRDLSSHERTSIDLVELAGTGQDLYLEVTRADFEFQVEPLLQRCMDVVADVLAQAHFTAQDVDDLVVVGGASRMPWLRQALRAYFPRRTAMHMTDAAINADEAVAVGAAVMAYRVGAPKIPPPERKDWVDPRDLGPAPVDATPRTIGIQLGGNQHRMKPIIPKSSQLPAEGRQLFTTSIDDQETIVFEIFEGEDPITDNNRKLGEFSLTNVEPGPAGSASITVTMRINEEGVLQVSAKNNRSGLAAQLKVEPLNRMPVAELDTLTEKAAESRAEAGDKHRGRRPPKDGHNGLGLRRGSGSSETSSAAGSDMGYGMARGQDHGQPHRHRHRRDGSDVSSATGDERRRSPGEAHEAPDAAPGGFRRKRGSSKNVKPMR